MVCPLNFIATRYTDGSSIPIHERVELPEDLIPADSRVEIDAKITAGELSIIWICGCRAELRKVTSPPANGSRPTNCSRSKDGYGRSE